MTRVGSQRHSLKRTVLLLHALLILCTYQFTLFELLVTAPLDRKVYEGDKRQLGVCP